MTITKTCFLCASTHSIEVPVEDYRLWKLRRLKAQDAFPYFTDTQREQLISGMCPSCQITFFADDED